VRVGSVAVVDVLYKIIRLRVCQAVGLDWPSTQNEKAKGRRRPTHHSHRVELLQTAHRPQQQHNDSSSLDRLDRPRQQVRCERLKVLKDEHAECLTEDLGRVFVVAVEDEKGSKQIDQLGELRMRYKDRLNPYVYRMSVTATKSSKGLCSLASRMPRLTSRLILASRFFR
jgi:hypothetical protein